MTKANVIIEGYWSNSLMNGAVINPKGKIIHQELKPYTMCVHTFVGGGYESMAVLVAEVIRYETEDSSSHK